MVNIKPLKIGDLSARVPVVQGGILGVNIMVATRKYEEYVKAAVTAGIDLIISGAGLPMDLPKIVGAAKTKLAPIVSSVKSAQVIMRYKPDQTPYCITDALINAVKGKVDEALLFCGANAYRAVKLEHVKDIMDEFRPAQAGVC